MPMASPLRIVTSESLYWLSLLSLPLVLSLG